MIKLLVAAFAAFTLLVSIQTAEAKPRHHRHHATQHHTVKHHKHVARRHAKRHRVRHVRAQPQDTGFFGNFFGEDHMAFGAPSPSVTYSAKRAARGVYTSVTFGGSSLVAYARTQIGNGPIYGRSNLWCARFMNVALERTGHRGTGSDMARSFAHYGRRVSGPQVGAIAVMSRRHGGHVGVVSGIDAHGNPIIISGNHGHRVAEAAYPRSRVYAYVMPES